MRLYGADITGSLQTTGSISLSGSFKDQESSSGTAGQVLSSTVSGSQWVDASSGDVIKTGTIVANQIAIWNNTTNQLRSDPTFVIDSDHKITLYQPNSSNNDRSSYNIGGGNIDNVTGQFNTGFGKNNLTSIVAGSQNIAIGANALSTNTDGDFNIAVGYNSLLSLTTGASNTAYGNQTLQANTYASQNSAFGTNALILNVSGASNTALGYLSLGANTSGPNNVAVGALALRNSTGTTNTAIGHSAGSAITTGDKNVIIGTNTGSTIATSDNNIIISDGDGNIRQFINGSGETFWGNSPKQAYVYVDTTNDIALIGSLGTGMDLGFITGTGTNKLTISSGGNVGIGTGSTAPQNNLTIQTATDVRVGIYGGVGYSGIQSISDNNNVWKSLRLDGSDIEFRIQDVPKLTISSGGAATFSGGVEVKNETAATFARLTIDNTINNYNSEISFKSIYGGTTAKEFRIGSNIAVGSGSWEVYDVTAAATRFTISSGGNVAIGATGADSQFKVELKPAATILAGLRIGYNNTSQNYYDADEHFFRNGIGTNNHLAISSTGETTIKATSTSGLILAQTGQSYYHNIRNQGDSLYIGADDGGQGGAGADMRFAVKGSEAMRLDSGYSVTAPNLQWTTLFDIGVKLSPGSTAIVTVYASSGSGLGMATLLVMRDGYGSQTFTELGTQPTATYLSFRLNPSNLAQLQVNPSISSGNHTIKGKLLIIKS